MVSPRLFAAKGGWQGLSVGICVAGRQKVATLDVEDVDGEFVSNYKGRRPDVGVRCDKRGLLQSDVGEGKGVMMKWDVFGN